MSEGSARRSDRANATQPIVPGQSAEPATTGPETMPPRVATPNAAPTAARRISRRRLTQLAVTLSDRDRAILSSLDAFGFSTSRQLEALHFAKHRTPEAAARICRRVLQRLHRDRLIAVQGRRIGGLAAGSSATIWRLDVAGDRLLRQDSETPRRRFKEPSPRFLDHRLAVADAVVALTQAAADGHGLELVDWQTEPDSWRHFDSGFGAAEQLKPDLFVVTASGDFEDHWFVEIDRATESLPTVLGKCEQYERYRRAGVEQAGHGLFPRVIWCVPGDARRRRLAAGIARSSVLDPDLFHVVITTGLVPAIHVAEKGGEHA